MKYYRLIKSDPRYGMMGNVIPGDAYNLLPYTDKPLYHIVDPAGRGYAYEVHVGYVTSNPSLYYLDDYEDVIKIIERIADREGIRKERTPLYVPKTFAELYIASYIIKIKYRKEWEQESQGSSSSSPQGT